jgi:prepilin-type N-terminal cleavage/methylation domain-containing protein
MSSTQHEDRDGGFSIMELLIAILVLGILGGIAILSVRPFDRAAVELCFDVEFANLDIVAAAHSAGIDLGDFDPSDDIDCVPIALEFANAHENPNSVVTLQQQPQPGRTMVAITGHRASGSPTPVICSGAQYVPNGTCNATTAGWQLHGVFTGPSSSIGPGISVWTKHVQPDEPTTVRANWVGAPASISKFIIVGVFNRQLTVTGLTQTPAPTASNATTLALGPASGLAGPAVAVAGIAITHPSGWGPCTDAHLPDQQTCVQWSGISGIRGAAAQGSSVYGGMAWTPLRQGAGSYEAVASWTHSANRHAVGFTMILNLFVDP